VIIAFIIVAMSSHDTLRRNSKSAKGTSPTPSGNLSAAQRFACFCVGFFCIALLTMTQYPQVIDSYTHIRGDIEAKLDAGFVTIPLMPQRDTIQGVEHYYLLPPKDKHNKKVKGILIFLHSCKRSGLEFFHLPEDRIIAYDALHRGLAVLAPTSQHRESGCFTQLDIEWIDQVVEEWAALHHLEKAPRMGMAVSSGASFLIFIYKSLKLKSMAVYNSPQSFPSADLDEGLAIPTVFVTMPLDEALAKEMETNYDQLLNANIPTQLYKVTPHPFTPALCLARFPEMIPKDCDTIFEVIQRDFPHLLDAYGFVKESMKLGQWQQLFAKLGLDDYQNDFSYYQDDTAHSGHSWQWAVVEQEVRTCEGFHAMTAEHHSSVLDFLTLEAGIVRSSSSQSSQSKAGGSS
jgi:hypothetical protein